MALRDAWAALRARWWMAFLGLVLGGGIAVAISLMTPTTYTSETQFFVATTNSTTSTDVLQGSQFAEQRASSYANLLTGEELAGLVLDDVDLDLSAGELAERITATPVMDTVLIDVTVSAPSAEEAQAIAAAIGAEFPQLVDRLEQSISEDGNSPVQVTVTRPADLPTDPAAPQLVRDGVIGLLAGLVLGVAASLLRAAWDRSTRDPEEITEHAGAPVVGVVMKDRTVARRHVFAADGTNGAAEGFRHLAAIVQARGAREGGLVLMVAGALPDQGTTTVAVNLAGALAEAGRSVALVEADLRAPEITSFLGLEPGPGLAEVLTGDTSLDDALRKGEEGVSMLTASGPHERPRQLLASTAMADTIASLCRNHDVVIVDVPPLLPVADATTLAGMVDEVLLVVRFGGTRKAQLRQARATLDAIGVRLAGVVLTMVPRREEPIATHGYRYRVADHGQGGSPETA